VEKVVDELEEAAEEEEAVITEIATATATKAEMEAKETAAVFKKMAKMSKKISRKALD